LIRTGWIRSAHDCSEGGLAVAIAESCFNPKQKFGAEVNLPCSHGPVGRPEQTSHSDVATTLFNESQSRIVISVAPANLDKAIAMLKDAAVPFHHLGKVGGDKLRIEIGNEKLSWAIADLYDDWWNSIRRLVESDSGAEGIPSL
jgi:phosphoribosylformylglycinamidine synthase